MRAIGCTPIVNCSPPLPSVSRSHVLPIEIRDDVAESIDARDDAGQHAVARDRLRQRAA